MQEGHFLSNCYACSPQKGGQRDFQLQTTYSVSYTEQV